MPSAACSASVPALQANSQSADWAWGVAPSASATIVPVGLTAYDLDSVPTQTVRSSCGAMPARRSALRAASMAMVVVSSSRPGTDFSFTGKPPSEAPQMRPTSDAGRRYRGT